MHHFIEYFYTKFHHHRILLNLKGKIQDCLHLVEFDSDQHPHLENKEVLETKK